MLWSSRDLCAIGGALVLLCLGASGDSLHRWLRPEFENVIRWRRALRSSGNPFHAQAVIEQSAMRIGSDTRRVITVCSRPGVIPDTWNRAWVWIVIEVEESDCKQELVSRVYSRGADGVIGSADDIPVSWAIQHSPTFVVVDPGKPLSLVFCAFLSPVWALAYFLLIRTGLVTPRGVFLFLWPPVRQSVLAECLRVVALGSLLSGTLATGMDWAEVAKWIPVDDRWLLVSPRAALAYSLAMVALAVIGWSRWRYTECRASAAHNRCARGS